MAYENKEGKEEKREKKKRAYARWAAVGGNERQIAATAAAQDGKSVCDTSKTAIFSPRRLFIAKTVTDP